MKGLILSADSCNDLRILKNEIPRAMILVGNKPVADWMLRHLKMFDVEELMISVHHHSEEVRDYFGYGSRWGVRIWYSQEPELVGNAGSLKRVQDFFGNKSFIVSRGGVLSDIDVGELVDFHKTHKALATMALVQKQDSFGTGVYLADDGVSVSKIQKGYMVQNKKQGYKSCGVYVLEPRVFEYIPKKKLFDMEEDLLPELLENGERICGFVHRGYWLDINSLEDFKKANFDILSRKVNIKVSAAGTTSKDGIWIGDGTEIHQSVQIRPPVSIGNDCLIREGTRLIGPVVIGDNTIIDKDVTFQKAIEWARGYIGKDSRINNALIGDSTYISSDVEICGKVTVGVNCIIGPHSAVREGVTLSPGTIVEKNSEVSFAVGNKSACK